MMASAWTVYCKELLDALRDRRTLLMVLLSSVAVGPLVLVLVSQLVSGIEKRAEARVVVVQGMQHAPSLANYLARQTYSVVQPPPDFERLLRDSKLAEPVLVVAADFEALLARGEVPVVELLSSAGNQRAVTGSRQVLRLLRGFNQEQATLRLAVRGISPVALEAMQIEERDLANPATRAAQLATMKGGEEIDALRVLGVDPIDHLVLPRLLALVPYLLARPGVRLSEVAATFGVTEDRLRKDLNLLWVCGLPGHGPGDLIDVEFEGETVTLTEPAGVTRPLRLTVDEALALVVALRTLAETPGLDERDAVDRALAKVELVFDLDGERVARPGVLDGLPGIPLAQGGTGELGEQDDDVEPRQLVSGLLTHLQGIRQLCSSLLPNWLKAYLCSSLLHKLPLGAVFGEKLHVFEVSGREPLHVREGRTKIGGKPVDDFRPPALAALAFQDVAADVVVEADLLGIGREQGPLAGSLDAGFQAHKPVGVIDGEREEGLVLHACTSIFFRWASTLAARAATSSTICGNGAA